MQLLGVALQACLLPGLIQGGFQLEAAAWRASEVIEVSEGSRLDGEVSVVAVWRGSLPRGGVHQFRALGDLAPTARRAGAAGPCPQLLGRRLVLFLRRAGVGEESRLEPAIRGRLDLSVLWLERGRGWALGEGSAPELLDLGPETDLRRHVERVGQRACELQRAAATADPARRARELVPFAVDPLSRDDAFEAIIACRAPGVPTLAALLDPELPTGPAAARALARVGGPGATAALLRALEEEERFWSQARDALPDAWWRGEGLAGEDRVALSARYTRLTALLLALEWLRPEVAREPVQRQLRLWSSAGALIDALSGAEEGRVPLICQRVLLALEPDRPQPE